MSAFDGAQAVLPLDAPPEAREAAAAAIQEAAEGAGPWMEKALAATYAVASRKPLFTTDAIWAELEEEQPDEPRAMGATMRQAARVGWIESSGMARPSTRKVCHGRPVTVWRSLLLQRED